MESVRSQARQRFERGATGTQIAGGLSLGFDEIVLFCLEDALESVSEEEAEFLRSSAAVVAVGGSGRGEMAPYSDVDLLFLYHSKAESLFSRIVAEVVRSAWDTGLKLGHSVRAVKRRRASRPQRRALRHGADRSAAAVGLELSG